MGNEPLYVSLVALIANPARYQGLRVRVVGYVIAKMETSGILLSEGDFTHGITKNGVWLDMNGTEFTAIDERYALVEGTFDETSKGHLGMWSGTIGEVTFHQPWPQEDRKD